MGNLMWLWITLGSVLFASVVLLTWYFVILGVFNKICVETKNILIEIDEVIEKKQVVLDQLMKLLSNRLNAEIKKEISQMALKVNQSKDLIHEKEMISDNLSLIVRLIEEQVIDDVELSNNTHLQTYLDEWTILEESLQVIRIAYNSKVSKYNKQIVGFPTRIVAKLNHLNRLEFFESNLMYVTA